MTKPNSKPRRALGWLAALIATTGCGNETTEPSPQASTVRVEILAGDGQTGKVGQTLDQPLQVRTVDREGRPIDGIVRFQVEAGGGDLRIGPTTGTELDVSTTNGVAFVRWTLGTVAGAANRVTAWSPGNPAKVEFNAVARPGTAAAILPISREFDSVPVGPSFSVTIQARVVDAYQNPAAGEPVTWISESPAGQVDAFQTTADEGGAVVNRWTVTPKTGPLYGAYSLALELRAGFTRLGMARFVRAAGPAHLTARAVVGGATHTCALGGDGTASCWGSGALGDDSSGTSPWPVPVSGGQRFTSLAAGDEHTCGLTDAGAAWCWGANDAGQLGADLSQRTSRTPIAVVGSPPLLSIAAAGRHTCGLDHDGGAWCWGANESGQLGIGSQINRRVPTAVATNARFTALALGTGHSCGRTASSLIYCWGANGSKQVISDARQVLLVPTPVGVSAELLATADNASCGVAPPGKMTCWGAGLAPHDRGTGRYTQVAGAGYRICGLSDGDLTCQTTGRCTFDYAGTICVDDWLPPEQVATGFSVTSFAIGWGHLCAIGASSGVVYCSGSDLSGELGLGYVSGFQAIFRPVLIRGRP